MSVSSSPVPLLRYVLLKRVAQTMKSVLRDWQSSLAKSPAPRVKLLQTFQPTEAWMDPLEMAEPVVVLLDRAVWVAMVDKVVLLGKAAREALVAKAVVGKRAPRVRLSWGA